MQALTGQPRAAADDEERDREQEPAVETAALFEALTAGLPVDDDELDDEQRSRRLLAHLLEFHRREDKSMWPATRSGTRRREGAERSGCRPPS